MDPSLVQWQKQTPDSSEDVKNIGFYLQQPSTGTIPKTTTHDRDTM